MAQGGPRWPLGHLGFSQGFSLCFDPRWPRRPTHSPSFGFFPSTASQSVSSIGGGTTRENRIRTPCLSPFPPRARVLIATRPNSCVLPLSVSNTSLSKRPPTSTSPSDSSSASSLIPITPLPTPERIVT